MVSVLLLLLWLLLFLKTPTHPHTHTLQRTTTSNGVCLAGTGTKTGADVDASNTIIGDAQLGIIMPIDMGSALVPTPAPVLRGMQCHAVQCYCRDEHYDYIIIISFHLPSTYRLYQCSSFCSTFCLIASATRYIGTNFEFL